MYDSALAIPIHNLLICVLTMNIHYTTDRIIKLLTPSWSTMKTDRDTICVSWRKVMAVRINRLWRWSATKDIQLFVTKWAHNHFRKNTPMNNRTYIICGGKSNSMRNSSEFLRRNLLRTNKQFSANFRVKDILVKLNTFVHNNPRKSAA